MAHFPAVTSVQSRKFLAVLPLALLALAASSGMLHDVSTATTRQAHLSTSSGTSVGTSVEAPRIDLAHASTGVTAFVGTAVKISACLSTTGAVSAAQVMWQAADLPPGLRLVDSTGDRCPRISGIPQSSGSWMTKLKVKLGPGGPLEARQQIAITVALQYSPTVEDLPAGYQPSAYGNVGPGAVGDCVESAAATYEQIIEDSPAPLAPTGYLAEYELGASRFIHVVFQWFGWSAAPDVDPHRPGTSVL